ncbi:MAG TPA: biopolymer transporter ExbD [Bacteroidales bacterium]|nr:biopolymer transporter ExbD [Bacteroidales bacterium]HOH22076.1 biopolymer transporter ExbD [Bacteroidales bacterium]HPZ04201.1 biopolymer transporter ExbD [Bacteroidales bacterium]HQB75845.1 biopolymer transporter ExbD [Bacteroidales bacterium]
MARKTPGINTGSMADISFLLLTFFLLTSSINTEQGIPRRLPPHATEEVKEQINERNVLNVVVNFKNEISVNSQIVFINQLKDKAKEFIENPYDDPNLPVKETKSIDYIGDYRVSQGVISLKNDQSTSYDVYIQVQNELEKAVNELRDKVSLQYFGKKYELLDTALQSAVKKAVPMQISEAKPMDWSNTGE